MVVATLVLLSIILTISTLFPSVDVTKLAIGGSAAVAAVLLAMGVAALRARRGSVAVTVLEDTEPGVPREQWTMPPAALLSRPEWSPRLRAAMLALGGYMVLATILLIVKTVQLAGG